MLTTQQIDELKEHLNRAQNPVFYFDNDADGLCSFVIFRRALGKGKGVAIRSFPELHASYARKAIELNADYVFVIDKPLISREFFNEIEKLQIPLVWIDHHEVQGQEIPKDSKNVFIYNPARLSGNQKSYEPATYLSYKATGRKEDLWIAVMGCVADHYMPEFASEFAAFYPEFWGNVKDPFEAYYKTEIGKIAMALNFGLKDSVSHVVKLQNFLISCRGPDDVLSESSSNFSFRKKFSELKKKYYALLNKAKNNSKGKLLFFEYGGELSISSDLANELSYLYPDKYIAVVYKKEAVSNISLRGKQVRQILEKLLKEFEGSGGGHDNAVGARLQTKDINKFKEALEREISAHDERSKN